MPGSRRPDPAQATAFLDISGRVTQAGADANSEQVLLEFAQPFSNHNGGIYQLQEQ